MWTSAQGWEWRRFPARGETSPQLPGAPPEALDPLDPGHPGPCPVPARPGCPAAADAGREVWRPLTIQRDGPSTRPQGLNLIRSERRRDDVLRRRMPPEKESSTSASSDTCPDGPLGTAWLRAWPEHGRLAPLGPHTSSPRLSTQGSKRDFNTLPVCPSLANQALPAVPTS